VHASQGESLPPRGRFPPGFPVILALAALGGGILLIRTHEAVYWADGIDRFAHRHELLVWRWLPALQAWIVAAAEISPRIEVLRVAVLLPTVLAIPAFAAAVRAWAGSAAANLSGLLLATGSGFVVLATQAYQEGLFVLLLSIALAARSHGDRSGSGPGAVRAHATALGATSLLCLTRYEGWLVALLFALEDAVRAGRRAGARAALRSIAVSAIAGGGLVILVWMILAPPEVQDREAAFLHRLALRGLGTEILEFLGVLRRQMPDWAFLLAGAGIVLAGFRCFGAGLFRHLVVLGALLAVAVILDPLPAPRRPILVLVLLLPFVALGAMAVAGLVARRLRLPGALRSGMAFALAGLIACATFRDAWARLSLEEAEPRARALRSAARTLRDAAHPEVVLIGQENSRRLLVIHTAGSALRILSPGSAGPAALEAALGGRTLGVVLPEWEEEPGCLQVALERGWRERARSRHGAAPWTLDLVELERP
jgi:hypothetical protein